MTDAKPQNYFTVFYLIAIFFGALFSFYPKLMDPTLLSRYAITSIVFLLTGLFLIAGIKFKSSATVWPKLDLPTGLFLSYILWTTISTFWATNFSEAIFDSQKAVLGFAAFYMCRWFQLNDEAFIPRLLKTITVASGIILLVAAWQVFQLNSTGESTHYEIRGISGHKNLFSIALFLITGFLSLAYFRLEKKWSSVAAVFIVLSLLLIIYLRTRSVYLGIAVAGFIFIFWKFKKGLRPKLYAEPPSFVRFYSTNAQNLASRSIASALSSGILVLVILFLLGFLYAWQTNQLIPLLQMSKVDQLWDSDTGYERLMLWEKTACVIQGSPLCGVGAGNWQIAYPNCSVHGLYSVELNATTFQRPHNDWFWVWAETGLIGLCFYLGFFMTILKRNLQQLKKEGSPTNGLMALTRLSFIIGFMVVACFSFPKERIELLLLIYTFMGLYHPVVNNQNLKSAYFGKLILILIIINSTFNLFISAKRMTGEKTMKEVLLQKEQKNWSALINTSEEAFSKWYTVDPTTIPIHWYSGTANFSLGNQEAALQDFLKAEKYTPYNQYVQNDLGTCYLKIGQREKAMAHYEEAIRISPMFDDPRVNIGISYFNMGEYQKALDWINSIQNHDLKLKYREIIVDKIQ